jgi:hypothetical protein
MVSRRNCTAGVMNFMQPTGQLKAATPAVFVPELWSDNSSIYTSIIFLYLAVGLL